MTWILASGGRRSETVDDVLTFLADPARNLRDFLVL